MEKHILNIMSTINNAMNTLNYPKLKNLLSDVINTQEKGTKVVVSGLGKNVPICEKFVGTMNSLGLRSAFMHTNSAAHGDLGIAQDGDLLILLTKSGRTAETVYLYELLAKRNVKVWLLTFGGDCPLVGIVPNVLTMQLDHEGDAWDILPNNSTTLYLIILQAIAICAAEQLGVTLEQFAHNHPGGHIGERLLHD